jgi:NADH pyrophosphatase NudC (nudix superfamily)
MNYKEGKFFGTFRFFDNNNFSKNRENGFQKNRENNTDFRKDYFRNRENQRKKFLAKDYSEFMNWRKERLKKAVGKGGFLTSIFSRKEFCPCCGKKIGRERW